MPVPPTVTQRTSKGHPDENNASEDYLQDPNLWQDQLPQPFRMIDYLLGELYSNAWDDIERREIEREHIAARVKVPELTDFAIIEGVQGVKDVCGGRDGLIFVGERSGLSAFRGVAGSEKAVMDRIAHCDTTTEVNSVAVGWNNGIHCIATLHYKEVKVFALVSSHLVFLTDVINTSGDEEDPASPIHISISESSSHLSVTMTHPQDGTKLHLYKLPLNNWHNELNQCLERVTNAEIAETKEETEDIVYTKAAPLFILSPPSPLTPCTAPTPTTALQSVCDGQRHHVPTGELHILSQCYFDKRRKAFVSQRGHFVSAQPDTRNYQHSVPTCHFLYYKNTCRQETPCYLSVWWQHHTQLFIYPLADSSKGPPLPHRVLPQASAIVATSVKEDSSRIAIALHNGVIAVWSLSTAMCMRVVSTGITENITTLLFIERDDTLCVGTSGGKVMVVSTLGSEPIIQLNQRVSKQAETHSILFSSSPYDIRSEVISLKMVPTFNNVIASIHSDGTLTMWSANDREALCTLPESCLVGNGHCSFTSDGANAVILVENKQNESESSCLMSVNLQVVPTLTPHHLTHPHITHHDDRPITTENNMILTVEAYLKEYTKRFMTDERWKNGSEVLAS